MDIETYDSSEKLNLSILFNLFLRNKKLLIAITTAGIVLSGIYSLLARKTWQGEFQMILKLPQNESISTEINLPFQNNSSTEFETNVEILKSRSLLLPVFENYKKEINKKIKYETTFEDWVKNNLEVNLKKGTKVIDIKYRDKNKELLLPVLKEISIAYQDYSKEISRKFYEDKIDFLSEYSNSVKLLNNDSDLILKLPNQDSILAEKIFQIKNQMLSLQRTYSANDEKIRSKKRQIDQLKIFVKNEVVNGINFEIIKQKALLRSVNRPWQFIKNPILLPEEVAPNKKTFVALGFLSGFLISCFMILLLERKKDLIYDIEDLQKYFSSSEFFVINPLIVDHSAQIFKLIVNKFLNSDVNKEISLIPLGDLKKNDLKRIAKDMNDIDKDINFVINDIYNSRLSNGQIIISQMGLISRKELSIFMDQLKLQGKPVPFIIVLNDSK